MNRLIAYSRRPILSTVNYCPMRVPRSILFATGVAVVQGFSPAIINKPLQYSTAAPISTIRFLSSASNNNNGGGDSFRIGDAIQIEVTSFGPMGASVDVVGQGHNPDSLIPENDPALGQGLILQKEIHYFRQARDNIDVVQGEVLPAYVEYINDDGKLNICLRKFGGQAKAEEVSEMIMERLEEASGELDLGDKSSPEDIAREFPGVSKGAFKKAIGALYRKGKLKPGPYSISVMEERR